MSRNDGSSTVLQRLANTLGYAAIFCGFLTILTTAYLAIRAYSPVWFADDWQVAIDYMALGGHYPLAKFWTQHNEHRVPFMKAMMLFDLFYLHGNHAFLIAVNYLFQVAEWLAFTFFLKRLFQWEHAEFLTAAGLAGFLIVNPNQMQNVEFAFTAFFTAYAFSVVSLGSLAAFHLDKWKVWIALAVGGAFVAEFSLASGILVLAILPISAYLLGMSMRWIGSLAAVATFGIGLYLFGYQSPPNATKPLEALAHPIQVIGFLVAYFGESWHYVFPQLGTLLAVLAIVAVVGFAIYRMATRRLGGAGEVFLLALAILCLSGGFLTALGRQVNGVAQAREGRYQTPAMLFWCCIGVFALLSLRKLGSNRVIGLIALQAIFCVLFVAESFHFPAIYQFHENSGYIRDTAGAALESGVDALERIRMIYPGPATIPPTYSYLVNLGLMFPPLGMQSLMGVSLASRFRVVPAGNCVGAMGTVAILGMKNGRKELYVDGWASRPNLQPFPRLVSVTEEGVIDGVGVSGGERPDVIKAVPAVTNLNSGWNLYALVPPAARSLAIYGLIPGTDLVCEIPYPKPIPQ